MSTELTPPLAAAVGATLQASLLGAGSPYVQDQRLILLETPLGAQLIAERFRLDEGVNALFESNIDAFSANAFHALTPLIGEQITVKLWCADAGSGAAGYRPWHGLIASASQLGSDGGWVRYRFVVRPWLSLLGLRRDSFVFQDMTTQQILDEVLRDCPGANFRFDTSIGAASHLRSRSLCTQHGESDLAFVTRLMAEEGWSYHFEHLDAAAAAQADRAGQARHVMVITDRMSQRVNLGPVRFARPDVNGVAEAIDSFAEARLVQPTAVTRASWNYRQLAGSASEQVSSLAQGEVARLEDYDGSGAYRYQDNAHAEHAAALRLAWHELGLQRFSGTGSSGLLRAGANFSLIDHPSYGANATALTYAGQAASGTAPKHNAFTLITVELEAANNLGSELARLLQRPELQHGSFRTRFDAVPAMAAIVPHTAFRPTAPGSQTAVVTGLAHEALTTERDLRVKVQLPWQRGVAPLDGGLPHDTPTDTQGNAPGNENAGTWVRVAQNVAGANWGSVFTPRSGTEVLVDWIEGRIDRPVIVAQLHNGNDALPWPAGTEAGSNHPGTVAGWHSHTLDQGGLNHWLVDDATGQCRMRIASMSDASPWSELSVGHLISQGPRSAQRGAWLGSGFYGYTDGWLQVRSASGLFLSTASRPGSYGSAQSTQMDAQEAVAQLKGAQQLGQALDTAAKAQGALGLTSHANDPVQAVSALIKATDPAQDAKYDDQRKAVERNPGDPVERFATPLALLDTPSTAAFTTPASIASFAAQDFSLTAQADLHATAAHTASWVSGETTSLYTHAGELQAIAANGNFSLRAHTDTLSLLADQEIVVISVNDEIRIQASTSIELIGGRSKLSLSGENIDFACPGSFTVKSSGHAWQGAGKGSANLSTLPNGSVDF